MRRFLPGKNSKLTKNQRTKRYRYLASSKNNQIHLAQSLDNTFDDDDNDFDGGDGDYSVFDAEADEEVEEEEYSPADTSDPRNASNFYFAVLMGINWWRHLRAISPKIPTRITPAVMKEISQVNTRVLEEKFGTKPTRAIIPHVESFLNVEIYCLYGGSFSPLGICYRPHSSADSVESLINKLEKRGSQQVNHHDDKKEEEEAEKADNRPVIILQSARPFFHFLETYHILPCRKVFENRDSQWVSLWTAIIKTKWPKLAKSFYDDKIKYIKKELFGKEASSNNVFGIGDGVFHRIRRRFGINVRIFVAKVVNDNVNMKRCVYSTLGDSKCVDLNLLVASFQEDEFRTQFERLTNVAYDKFVQDPTLLPGHSVDVNFRRRRAICDKRMSNDRMNRILKWSSNHDHQYHQVDDDHIVGGGGGDQIAANDDDALSDVVDFDNLTNDASSEKSMSGLGGFLDRECAASDSSSEYSSYTASVNESVNIGYKPIMNVLSIAPNVLDDNTRVRILTSNQVKTLFTCKKTKGCLFTSSRKDRMVRHERCCTGEPQSVFRQKVEDWTINQHIDELFLEKYLPSRDYIQDFYVTYDIESIMSNGPFSVNPKYHNLASIAVYTSHKEKYCFIRKTDHHAEPYIVCCEFINYLTSAQKKLLKNTPACINEGVEYYSELVERETKNPTLSFDKLEMAKRKLKYLKDFFKLKVYSWVGERYDMVVIFPAIVLIFSKWLGPDQLDQLNLIKRSVRYMMIDCLNISFRDFKN